MNHADFPPKYPVKDLMEGPSLGRLAKASQCKFQNAWSTIAV